MRKPSKKTASKYVESVAKKLAITCSEVSVRVNDWACKRGNVHTDSDHSRAFNKAIVNIYAPFSLSAADEQRCDIVRSLLYWEVDKLHSLAMSLSECHPKHVPATLKTEWNEARWALVDRLSRMIAPHMPAPPWTKKKGKR